MLHKLCEEIIKYANTIYVQQITNWIQQIRYYVKKLIRPLHLLLLIIFRKYLSEKIKY